MKKQVPRRGAQKKTTWVDLETLICIIITLSGIGAHFAG